ncbi:MAG: hydroxymethylbilane synthase [Tannerellaceae bacterium]|nr:hydroxymethylbilane synthase [Tannerellaceae bacterium]
MNKTLKIGTRDSELAVWQAEQVKIKLKGTGISAELVYIKSEGDLDLVTPLYEIGVQGVFTRALDIALLTGQIDLAVHSMKDVPTQPAQGIAIPAVLPRGNYKDVLVLKDISSRQVDEESKGSVTIATSSVRRRAQWLNRYPEDRMENLRGNINTRLQKVVANDWYGAVFAAAGLERIGVRTENMVDLDWMLPAPAQGIICITCRVEDQKMTDICTQINHPSTFLCATIERDFLRTLMGGCSTPIAGLALIKDEQVLFKGKILSLDGKESREVTYSQAIHLAGNMGRIAAEQLLENGGRELLEQIRNGK